MSDPITGELRWFIGKVTHCASNAKDLAEFAEWLEDVEIPPACVVLVDASHDHAHRAIHAAFKAIRLLYVDDQRLEAIAHIRLDNAIDDLNSRKSSIGRPSSASVVRDAAFDQSADESPPAVGDLGLSDTPPSSTLALEQSVSAGRDINAPIINTTGDVAINDRSDELHKRLHDYLTYIVFISLGIKQSHVIGEMGSVVEEALSALTSYHQKTYSTLGGASWGNYTALRRHALSTWESVDKACRAVLGLTLEEARLGLFESPFPEFDLFSDMVLVRGGFDPHTRRNVDPYYISRTPVTLGQYDEFCRTLQYPRVPEWEGMSPPSHLTNHPVTGVTLFDTVMFCVWLETATGFRFRLPTESEWCFAATEGRRQAYPWGDEYRAGCATTSLESPRGTTPVDARPMGASASGVLDLVGNVWELTSTLYADDPTEPDMDVSFPPMMFALAREAWWATDRRIPHGAGPWLEAARLVMRGGSWGGGPEWATMDRRIWTSMFNRGAYGGFRVVCSAQRIDNGYLPVPSYLSPRVAGFADRIQLTNSDGSSAVTQHDFGGCGGGGTAEGEISAQLRDVALARYQGVGDRPYEHGVFLDRAAEVANPSSFPQLRPHGTFRLPDAIAAVAGKTFGETSVERLVNGRVETETRTLLNAARTEAALRGQDRLTTGHVLLAMAMHPSRVAAVLATFGLDAERISSLLLVAPPDEGPNSVGNEAFSDALVRILLPSVEGYKGVTVEVLFHRIASEPTAIAQAIFEAAETTGDRVNARLRFLDRIRGVRFNEWGDDLDELDSALALLDVLPTLGEDLRGARVVLLSARPNILARKGAAASEVLRADDLARAERALLGDQIRDLRGGLIKELLLTYDRLRKSNPDDAAAAIAILDEIIQMEAEHDRYDSYLIRCVIDRGVVLERARDLEGALLDFDRAISLARTRRQGELRHTHFLALALNNRAAVLGQVGRNDEALKVITESLQILLPSLVAQERSRLHLKELTGSTRILRLREASPARLDLSPFETTLNDSCLALGIEPDMRVLAYLNYFRLGTADETRLSSLPTLDPPPLRLASGEEESCEFCGKESAVVSGVYAEIGPGCLELALEVFEAESGATGTDHGTCDFCGRPEAQIGPIVHSDKSSVCRGCVERAIQLYEASSSQGS